MIRIKRLIKSFSYAFKGLKKTFYEEQNLQIQGVVAFVVVVLAVYFKISQYEWMMIVLCIGIVFLMELVNSAIERVTDVLKPRIHDYVKEIKDIMASVVLLASILAVVIGVIIFLPYIFGVK